MNWAEFGNEFVKLVAGNIAAPNYEEVPLSDGVASLAASYHRPTRGLLLNDMCRHRNWALFWPNHTQVGRFDGSGLVMWYDGGKGRIGRFAFCKHEKVDGPGANHSRGWHPGHCSKCGLDMTVDSGD